MWFNLTKLDQEIHRVNGRIILEKDKMILLVSQQILAELHTRTHTST